MKKLNKGRDYAQSCKFHKHCIILLHWYLPLPDVLYGYGGKTNVHFGDKNTYLYNILDC